ncbi:MAG: prepilin peptidase [Chloroflexi bacterium]|nr:prepilin peptidase [Chloroflexota bacterium]
MPNPVVMSVLAFFLGASIGSFINVVADRLPRGESLVQPPSHCPACGRRLTVLELVPVFSYMALRGRCHQCHSTIPLRVLAVELIMGLLAIYVWLTSAVSAESLLVFSYASLFLLLAAIDLEYGIIPDMLVYPGLALGLLLTPWWRELGLEREFLNSTGRLSVMLGSLAGAVLGAGAFAVVILLRPGSMGWGDVKMAGLIGLVSGVPGTVVALLASLFSGGVAGAVLLVMGHRRVGQTMPFGPFLALGALLALLWGGPLWEWYVGLLR